MNKIENVSWTSPLLKETDLAAAFESPDKRSVQFTDSSAFKPVTATKTVGNPERIKKKIRLPDAKF